MFLRGFSVSSASGAAASKPENARRQKTDPAITPDHPSTPVAFACAGEKTERSLFQPALITRMIPTSRNTPISIAPRITPVRADERTPL